MDQLDAAYENMSLFVKDNRHPCILIDMDGTIKETNAMFRNRFSMEPDDNFLSLFKSKTALGEWYSLKGTSDGTKVSVLENLALSVGENVECLCTAHVFYSQDNGQAVVTLVLPAAFQALPESAYATSFSYISKIILLIDTDGRILDVNSRVAGIFDMKRGTLIGKSIHSVYRKFNTNKGEGEKQYEEYLRHLKLYGEVQFTERFENDPNDIKFFEIRVSYNREDDLYVMEVKDCTETEMLRQQLEHSGSLSTVGQMAASIAHEIRNPMTTLKGFVQLMETTADGDTAKYLAVVDSELQRMESILNEMLMLSKPCEGIHSEFSLGVLITKVLEIMKPKAMFESIQIDWHDASFCNSMIYSNADKLKQVLLNLFKNAFEAMEPGGILTLKLEKEENGSSFILTVKDTGKGMSDLQLKNIFLPFFTSKPEGTGLGLPFVLKTMEDLGGAVGVSSQLGAGTTFVLTFPVHCRKGFQEFRQLTVN
ncbi:ATP-binding protein [Sporosarcina trichiuri]|uniref:ATP-binding protein n=1 Tax=Sporosarcina trichiuri TaxID=3056445 RepID=UPI0025B32727|nr:ATP-binding protein [Sporosarcina sp. 0.2-SM1T-5]WJY28897.1 ATP-binding protein [Sporosarcina sp. 0.2-SM1T-5]